MTHEYVEVEADGFCRAPRRVLSADQVPALPGAPLLLFHGAEGQHGDEEVLQVDVA
jgi:hypothetical protein